MKLENTISGKLLKRYKRFFVDVLLDTGEIVVAHCPNTGPMTTCSDPGMTCILTKNDDPKRKLKYTLNLTKNDNSFILVNTHLPNRIIKEALQNGLIEKFKQYPKITPEFSIGNSRFDFLLENSDKKYLLEIKSASSIDKEGICIFPDTKSDRALKHVNELIELKKQGYECGVLFLIGREDTSSFRPAGDIMPKYLEACQKAYNLGIDLIPLQCKVTENTIEIDKEIELIL